MKMVLKSEINNLKFGNGFTAIKQRAVVIYHGKQ